MQWAISKRDLFLIFVSLLIVGFGQPAFIPWLGLLASCVGYSLFFKVLLSEPKAKNRLYLGTAWFTLVQCIQLSWSLSHPYSYIYPVYFFFAFAVGIQFGILSILITAERINSLLGILFLSSCWVIFEWLRLFFLSGYTWNPIGLALSGGIYPLQMANLWGVYGLSFWVLFVNLLFLRSWWNSFSFPITCSAVLMALLPYLYGMIHLHRNDRLATTHLNAVLVQSAFPVDSTTALKDRQQVIDFALNEWSYLLASLRQHQGKAIDLIVFPEFAVRCGTYSCVYPYQQTRDLLKEKLNEEHIDQYLPPLESPWAHQIRSTSGLHTVVNNAFIAQTLSNFFQSGVIIGLEDAENTLEGQREHYTAALYFLPQSRAPIGRYEKRVLIPLGEYIPFEFCRSLARSYGVYGSFIPGKATKIFKANNLPFGVSICYEETFGDLMSENKKAGAQFLVNLTNDAWYPNSLLPVQHFMHARLRTVENGFPLLRSTNMGMTGAIDSFGRDIALLGNGEPHADLLFDSIRIDIPIHNYQTLYSYFGDRLILILSFLIVAVYVAIIPCLCLCLCPCLPFPDRKGPK